MSLSVTKDVVTVVTTAGMMKQVLVYSARVWGVVPIMPCCVCVCVRGAVVISLLHTSPPNVASVSEKSLSLIQSGRSSVIQHTQLQLHKFSFSQCGLQERVCNGGIRKLVGQR